ncbi:MAG TPA: hypothetical protein DCO77_14545 [Nitrospiraceae bacterium]|nr:hypothetical protein [Nitrospiraceae bacterium]
MVDINYTLLIQLGNFIVLLIALHIILFRPMLRIMEEREQGISSALGDARSAQERMQKLMEEYDTVLAEARQKATATYNEIYQTGLDEQRDMIAAERANAAELLDKGREDIVAAADTARKDLKKEAERISQDISSTLLGRAV